MPVTSQEISGKSENTRSHQYVYIYICLITRSLDLCDIGTCIPLKVKPVCAHYIISRIMKSKKELWMFRRELFLSVILVLWFKTK